ncbi:aminotransferase class V-fold PLP-dependent enzyme [Sphingomonas sp. RHCKR47]|uniref:aminotransferase class I/II-fold pyridoxal phosphate-dependent enzyme n=1 Tax=Sphingomonas citricola TaxID=2862498 RepID=UPI001CA4794B|nr:aminotransferase class V-fold PLP-dependent enzyme [Sphingomonas citricola]MBW6523112.1 aminotransferase class V-fold PLP-dependent enzyme [Sphingomonas citricola]
MDQTQAPILDALQQIERNKVHGFGAPGHHQGAALPRDLARVLGKRVFEADVITPKGLDDRTEGAHVLQRAHEIAAEAWQADFCRFVTGGSTQSLHTALAAVAAPGDTVLLAANVHKAERAHALAVGLKAGIVPVIIDEALDIEHGVAPEALTAALDQHPDAKAFVVVSPTYYGVTSDIAALAAICHVRGVALICDAAWGGAFAFCEDLPDDPLTKDADIAVYSVHKTMGALTQGSALLARGELVDRQRLWMAYELFETTSPSVPILASLDVARREHALHGEAMWSAALARAVELRRKLSKIKGIRVLGRDDLPAGADLDETKVLIDVAALGVSGYAIDDWLNEHYRVSVGLSDARHLLAIIAPGTTASDVRALARGLAACAKGVRKGTLSLAPAGDAPPIGALTVEMAIDPGEALFGAAEQVPLAQAAGRIAAEMIAPAPPGVPRLVPGQRISATHVAWLTANRDAGAFFLDPIDPSERTVRVVAQPIAQAIAAE